MSEMAEGWGRVEVGCSHVGGEMYLLGPGIGDRSRNLSGLKRPSFE